MHIAPVTIIGAGPAGLAAAIQLKRYGINPIIFECTAMGGLLRNANRVENYPGFPNGIIGVDLANRFIQHARSLDIDMHFETVTSLDQTGDLFRVTSLSGTHISRIVVIATGTRPSTFSDFEIPTQLRERVYYEIFSFLGMEGKRFAIVGAGDAAFDYALNLARKNQIIILNRSERYKCLPLLKERSQAVPQIKIYPRTTITRITESTTNGIALECDSPTGTIRFEVDYLIGAIGREPQIDFIAPPMLERFPELEHRGILHRIGDVKNGMFRQTSIAVGDGGLAAMKIYRRLKETIE